MSSYTHYKKSSKAITDINVGYGYLDVDASDVVTLADGSDYNGSAVSIPDSATGVIITVKTMSTGCKMYYHNAGGVPDPTNNRGLYVDEALYSGARIVLGKTSTHNGDPDEMRDFKCICNIGETARIEYQFVKFLG